MGRHDVLLARVPEDLVGHARHVVDWLVGDTLEFSELGQADIQRMLWLDLPTRWSIPAAEWPDVVEASARVLELAHRPILASWARSDDTRDVLEAYSRSRDEGIVAANAAYSRTGTIPPDTDLLTWGRTMDGAEANAYDELRKVLEAAVAVGDYTPGGAGWRQRQRALVERWLAAPSAYFDGWRPIDVIHTVRREEWAETGTPARRRVLAEVEVMVREAVPVPDGEPAPLVWLFDRLSEGVRLTQRGYLPPALVREGDERFGWSPAHPASREVDLPQLRELHDLLSQHRLVTKRHDLLRPSTRGRAVLADPAALWETAASAWFGEHTFDIRVAEIAAAVLVKAPMRASDVAVAAHEAVGPEFRAGRGGELVAFEVTEESVWRWIRLGAALGFFTDEPHRPAHALSDVGRLAALSALRARAHAAPQ